MAMTADDYLKELARARAGQSTVTYGNNGVGNAADSKANEDRVRTDLGYNTDQLNKASAIMDSRAKAGLDTSNYKTYIDRLKGYRTSLQPQQEAQTTMAVAAPSTTTAAPSQPSASDLINSIYQNNYAAQAQKLKAARDQALAGLAGQDNLIKQNAYDNRNANDVMAIQALQRVREQQANDGINGGDSITATVANNTARQAGANSINQDQANKLLQLQAQRDAINNNASADDLALMQQLSAQRDQSLLGQYNADRSYGLDVAGLTGMLNGQRTLAGQQFDYNKSTDQRNFDYQKGIDQRNFDLQNTQTMAALTGHLPDGTPTNAYQQQQLENLWNVANYTGTIPDQLATMYGIPKGTKTQDALLRAAQANYYNDRGVYYDNRGLGGSPGGSSGSSSGGSSGGGKSNGTITDMSLPYTTDSMVTYIKNHTPGVGKLMGPPPPDMQKFIETQILSNPNLSDKQRIELYQKFGIPLPKG